MKKSMLILIWAMTYYMPCIVSADLIANWDFVESSGLVATDKVAGIEASLENMTGDEWGISNGGCKTNGLGTIELDNVDDYLFIPYDPNLDPGTGSFTVYFWYYTPDGEGGEIIHNGTSVAGTYSGKRYTVALSGGQIYWTIDDNNEGVDPVGKQWTAVSVPEPRAGVWHQVIAIRIAGVGLDLYVDGVPASPTLFEGGGDIVEEGENFFIGRRGPDESENSFGGKLADIRYYNHALSEAERLALSTTSTTAWCPKPVNGATNISLTTDLYWDAPSDANELFIYDVYLDTDSDPSDSYLTTVIGSSEPNVPNSVIGTLTAGDYWWRVDAQDPNGAPIRIGDVWTFNAGVSLPELVSPADGSADHNLGISLEWLSDNSSGLIVEHRLMLKNSFMETPESVDLPESASSYTLDDAALWDIVYYDRNYTWQIIELGAGDEVLAVGPEWSFSTAALGCTGLTAEAEIDGSSDCRVTLADFAVLASGWLECGWQLPGGGAIPYNSKNPCLQ